LGHEKFTFNFYLREYLGIIASDALEGRRTGTRGQKMAAAFIASQFQESGLTGPMDGSYYQPVNLYSSIPSIVFMKVGGTRYENFGEFFYTGASDTQGEIQDEIVFAGRGTEEDYAQVDVKDKAVVLLIGQLGPVSSLRPAVQLARTKGVKAVFVVSESSEVEFHDYVVTRKGFFASGGLSLKQPDGNANKGVFMVNRPIAEKLFNTTLDKLKKAADPKKKSLKKIRPGKVAYQVSMEVTTVKSENILGYLEGKDKKDELVIVTAHYDHIGLSGSGEDRINNGADDDGSGTVSVMELGKIFAKAKKEGQGPRRSMLFMTVTAEELGLFGSEYYVDHPVYPLANTVVDLNIDMIGRVDLEHKDSADYVYVIGSDKLSTELHQLSEKTNAAYTKLKFDYTYNDENHPTNLYQRSDHWNFAKNGVPIIFYFDGIHEDYHRPSDEVSKIDFNLLAKRAQCVFYTAWEIANRDQRIPVDKK
jgi:Peptidase family M28